LHADIWPSTVKFEAEIVSIAVAMLGGGDDPEICGTLSSGGTESILLAIKAYRDWARETRGIHHPEIVVPTTAHAAFEKAAQYFKIRLVRVPVGVDFRADLAATRRAINRNTIALAARRHRHHADSKRIEDFGAGPTHHYFMPTPAWGCPAREAAGYQCRPSISHPPG
jgi:hypothetical protein